MTIAYFDCFSGISGDMILGALVDLGTPVPWLKEQLARLPLSGFNILPHNVQRNGIQATRIEVVVEETHHHRDYGIIRGLIEKSELPQPVKTDSLAIFECLAVAEAKIHGCDADHVHFHEVGGMDAIVDIVGTCLAKFHLGIDGIVASPLPLGHGFVNCAHGVLPVPAPAVLEILKEVPVFGGPQDKELVTPTGAAIIKTLAEKFATLPPLYIKRTGYGAGSHELKDQPNALRVILGTPLKSEFAEFSGEQGETLMMVESCIDDMNPEIFGFLMDVLFEDGALDVFWVPVQMKKNRPGTMIEVLCVPEKLEAVTTRIFAETTTLGVRYHEVGRLALTREAVQVQTPFGSVSSKKVSQRDGTSRIVPEYESCSEVARTQGIPIRRVYEAVVQAAREDKTAP